MSKKTSKPKQIILKLVPYLIFAYVGNRFIYSYRTAPGKEITEKINALLNVFLDNISIRPFPSFHPYDFLGGALIAVSIWYFLWDMKKNKRKVRAGKEHGSAAFGTAKDFEPFRDFSDPDNNIILTQTEHLTMDVGSGANDRNKNTLVIGAPGTGKTLFVVKPGIMQMTKGMSFVMTDPKGGVMKECGGMLEKGRKTITKEGKVIYKPYKIKVFNTFDLNESMHYNPFAYFKQDTFTKDVDTFITIFQENTGEKESTGDKFFSQAEKFLYKACIGVVFSMFPLRDRNINTLCELITNLKAEEDSSGDDKTKPKPSKTEILFMALGDWIDGKLTGSTADPKNKAKYKSLNFTDPPTKEQAEIGKYALDNFKKFKQGAGKTMKSILISCSARLGVFDSKFIKEVISKDDLELDKIGDEQTALFIIPDDSDSTYNFLLAMMYAQLFKLLYDRAYRSPGEKLKYHVRFILDEFSNIGKIPDFEKKISTFRSRNISVMIIIQAMSQLKSLYKDDSDTIIAGCDSFLFLGSAEMSTLEWFSKMLGKETIDTRNYSISQGGQGSYSRSDQKTGRELMTPDELRRMPGERCILLVRGVLPFYSMKYNIKGHKNFSRLSDSTKNKSYIKNYIERKVNKKLIVVSTDEVRHYEFNGKGEN